LSGKKRFVFGIAGGSGSGKTTLAHRVIAACAKDGIEGQIFSLDNYYMPLGHLSFDERKAHNFDHPEALDLELAAAHVRALRDGHDVEQPVYDFTKHTRKKKALKRRPTPLLIVEGLYALYDRRLLDQYHFNVFVSTGIATAVLRRIQRDISERGRDVEGAKRQILTTVLPMYETYIKPTQRNAHFSINYEGEEIPQRATDGLVTMVRDFFR
jgi:uridine kinase